MRASDANQGHDGVGKAGGLGEVGAMGHNPEDAPPGCHQGAIGQSAGAAMENLDTLGETDGELNGVADAGRGGVTMGGENDDEGRAGAYPDLG